MTRSPITIPNRLQVLSFFLLVENIVKQVISRLRDEPGATVEAPTTDVNFSDLRQQIQDTLDDLQVTQASLLQEYAAQRSVIEGALQPNAQAHQPLSPLALSLFMSGQAAPPVNETKLDDK